MSSQLDPDVGRDDPSPHAPKSTRRMPARPRRVPDRPTSIRLWLPSLRCRWRDRSRTADPRRSSYP